MGMTTYYKATRPDGRDFMTGTIDYGAALVSGEIIRHPIRRRVKDDARTYLSVSVEPADCTGFQWPCRLFRVEPVGRPMPASGVPNKRAVSSLRVVEELPAWQAFGPNGEAVVAIIDRAARLTPDEARRLAAARAAAWAAAWDAAWAAAWDAARAAAEAELVRDLIPPEQYDLLIGPWRSVIEVAS
jgi:hypothetical protein